MTEAVDAGWARSGFSAACAVLLAIMLSADIAFIFVSAEQAYQGTPPNGWHVSTEGGIAERWQYVKWALLAVVLTTMAFRSRSVVYLAWAAIFLYLLLDDSLQIHEIYGLALAERLGLQPAFGLRAQDFGELMVTAAAAGPLVACLGLAYLGTSQDEPRGFTRRMLVLLVALGAFGVGVDMLDIMLPWPSINAVLGLVEDGGEMIVASLMATYAFHSAVSLRAAAGA